MSRWERKRDMLSCRDFLPDWRGLSGGYRDQRHIHGRKPGLQCLLLLLQIGEPGLLIEVRFEHIPHYGGREIPVLPVLEKRHYHNFRIGSWREAFKPGVVFQGAAGGR